MPGPFMATDYRRPGSRHRWRADLGGSGEKDDPSGTIPEFPNEMAFRAVQGSVAIGWGINDYQPKEAGALGINSYLGIVADVESNPGNPVRGVRSHGSDPDIVTQRVRNFVDGAQLGGPVLSGIQRFPGGGDVTQGPDGLPVLNHSREDWDRIDAVPFKQLTNSRS